MNTAKDKKWKRLGRKTLYDTKFLKVFEDRVELPNGFIYENYGIVQFPDVVCIVATTNDDKIITVREYKYGSDDYMRSFPAGHIDEGEGPKATARRELFEETGFGGGEFEVTGILREFSTKNLGKVFVVRAKNVEKIQDQQLGANEALDVVLISKNELKREIAEKKWQLAGPLAAITLTGVLNS